MPPINNGRFLHRYEPGEPGFTNPMAQLGYSYLQAVQDNLGGLEFSKRWMTQEQYEQQIEFWTRFGQLLEKDNAP